MKVVVECKVWFSNPINAGELSDATSGPMYGDYATLEDIECSPLHGEVSIATLVGNFDHPNRLDTDEDELIKDVNELVYDLLNQYGFPAEEIEVEIKEFLVA